MFPRNSCSLAVIKHFASQKLENGTPLFDGFNLDHSVGEDVLEFLIASNRTIQGNMEPGVTHSIYFMIGVVWGEGVDH